MGFLNTWATLAEKVISENGTYVFEISQQVIRKHLYTYNSTLFVKVQHFFLNKKSFSPAAFCVRVRTLALVSLI